MKANHEKLQEYFKYNYFQWSTPRTLREAKYYALIKAWRKQTREIKQGGNV